MMQEDHAPPDDFCRKYFESANPTMLLVPQSKTKELKFEMDDLILSEHKSGN